MKTLLNVTPAVSQELAPQAFDLWGVRLRADAQLIKEASRPHVAPRLTSSGRVIQYAVPYDVNDVQEITKKFRIFGQEIEVKFKKTRYFEQVGPRDRRQIELLIENYDTETLIETRAAFHEIGQILEGNDLIVRGLSEGLRDLTLTDQRGSAVVGNRLIEDYLGQSMEGPTQPDPQRVILSSVKRITHGLDLMNHAKKASLFKGILDALRSKNNDAFVTKDSFLNRIGQDTISIQPKETGGTITNEGNINGSLTRPGYNGYRIATQFDSALMSDIYNRNQNYNAGQAPTRANVVKQQPVTVAPTPGTQQPTQNPGNNQGNQKPTNPGGKKFNNKK